MQVDKPFVKIAISFVRLINRYRNNKLITTTIGRLIGGCGPPNSRDCVAGHSEGDQRRSDKRLVGGACMRAGAVGTKITLNEIGYITPLPLIR